jgi:carbamoyl-phosphate synthase small subunit
MGLTGIDTRRVVQHLRDNGAQMGALAAGDDIRSDELVERAREAGSMAGKEYVTTVTCAEPYTWNELPWSLDRRGEGRVSDERLVSRPHVVALDCGIKHNILRILVETGFRVTVVPATTSATGIMALRPDGLFLSNGPGDPATLGFIVTAVKEVLGKVPIFGICLGHQILGQVAGGKTYKLKFGHRGGNHPVRDETTGKVEITVQNHGFAVDPATLPRDVRITHVNLNDATVEGLELAGARAFSVQYHPEASPGPHDSRYLFRRFFENVVDYKRA